MEIVMSMLGIGELGAATLLAEIGNFKDFPSGDKLSSWLGIVPNVYQSANKYHNGRITKRGSKRARWILTPIAQAAARTKNSKLKSFLTEKRSRLDMQKQLLPWQEKLQQ
jgi:transposase